MKEIKFKIKKLDNTLPQNHSDRFRDSLGVKLFLLGEGINTDAVEIEHDNINGIITIRHDKIENIKDDLGNIIGVRQTLEPLTPQKISSIKNNIKKMKDFVSEL